MPNKQTTTDQIVWLLLHSATVQMDSNIADAPRVLWMCVLPRHRTVCVASAPHFPPAREMSRSNGQARSWRR